MISQWTETVGRDEAFAAQLDRADREMRIARSQESDGNDACAPLGIAGQRDPSNVKCLHAHVALSLTGVDDPIGRVLLDEIGSTCADSRCVRLAAGTERA